MKLEHVKPGMWVRNKLAPYMGRAFVLFVDTEHCKGGFQYHLEMPWCPIPREGGWQTGGTVFQFGLEHWEQAPSPSEAVDEGCICKGNWRAIVKEYEPKIGQTFKRGDKTYRFFGIVYGDDDYYYGLVELGDKVVLSSCVGSLETMGFDDESSSTAGEGKE